MKSSATEQSKASYPLYRQIAKGSLIVGLFVLLAGGARGVLEIFIAWRYGISAAVDAYYFVLNIVTWPIGIWFSTITVVLVPLLARIRREAQEDAGRFWAELLGATFIAALIVAAALFALLEFLFWSQWSGLTSEAREVASGISAIFWMLIPLGFFASLLTAWLLAESRYIGTLLEGMPALAALLVLAVLSDASLTPLLWATVGGFAARLLLLNWLVAPPARLGAVVFSFRSPWWGEFSKSGRIMFFGQALMALTLLIDQFFAAHMGEGKVASINYANRILAIVLMLGATAIQRGTLPTFSIAYVTGDKRLQSVVRYWVRLMLVLGALAAMAGWLLAPVGISSLFERGAFTALDTITVAGLFRLGLLQVPVYFGGLVLVSVLAAKGLHQLLAVSGIIGLAAKCVANVALIPVFGLGGLMIATAAMYAVTFGYLAWCVHKSE